MFTRSGTAKPTCFNCSADGDGAGVVPAAAAEVLDRAGIDLQHEPLIRRSIGEAYAGSPEALRDICVRHAGPTGEPTVLTFCENLESHEEAGLDRLWLDGKPSSFLTRRTMSHEHTWGVRRTGLDILNALL